MAANLPFVSPLLLLHENPEAVLAALRDGWVDHLGLAGDQVTDEHVGYALRSGLLAECAAAFPDPRCQPEIPIAVLLTASIAGAFQGEYALAQAGCALHSPALLAELGLNVTWLRPGEGLSRRGTQSEALFHGDGLRKLLLQLAAADREAGRRPGESLLDWWNQSVGPAFLRLVGGGTGAWIRDVTKLTVNLKNDRYEGSEVATQQKPARPGEKAPRRRRPSGATSWACSPPCSRPGGCWSRWPGPACGRRTCPSVPRSSPPTRPWGPATTCGRTGAWSTGRRSPC